MSLMDTIRLLIINDDAAEVDRLLSGWPQVRILPGAPLQVTRVL